MPCAVFHTANFADPALSHSYGRRYVVISVWALLCVAAIVSMTANSMSQMIIGQTLAGVGAGISGIMFAIASEGGYPRIQT